MNDEEMFLLSTTGRILFVAQIVAGESCGRLKGKLRDMRRAGEFPAEVLAGKSSIVS